MNVSSLHNQKNEARLGQSSENAMKVLPWYFVHVLGIDPYQRIKVISVVELTMKNIQLVGERAPALANESKRLHGHANEQRGDDEG